MNYTDPAAYDQNALRRLQQELETLRAQQQAPNPRQGLVNDGRGNLFFSPGMVASQAFNEVAGELRRRSLEQQEREQARLQTVRQQDVLRRLRPDDAEAAAAYGEGADLPGLRQAILQAMPGWLGQPEARRREEHALTKLAQADAQRSALQEDRQAFTAEQAALYRKPVGAVLSSSGGTGTKPPTVRQSIEDASKPQIFAGPATVVGVDPDGNEIRRVTKTGQLFTINPETGEYRAHTGATRPKPSAAATKELKEANAGIAGIDDAIESIKENPQALGLVNALPGSETIRQYTDPKGVTTRAKVANIGSLKVHDRSGAAVSAQEFPRLRPFIPQQSDSSEAATKKLEDLKAEYGRMQAEWAQAGTKPAAPADKSGGLPKAAGRGVTVKSRDEWAKLPPGTVYTMPDGRTGVK